MRELPGKKRLCFCGNKACLWPLQFCSFLWWRPSVDFPCSNHLSFLGPYSSDPTWLIHILSLSPFLPFLLYSGWTRVPISRWDWKKPGKFLEMKGDGEEHGNLMIVDVATVSMSSHPLSMLPFVYTFLHVLHVVHLHWSASSPPWARSLPCSEIPEGTLANELTSG